MQESKPGIKSIVIIDDKDPNYLTLGKKRKDLYVALVSMLKGFKWEGIKQCTVFFNKSDNSKEEKDPINDEEKGPINVPEFCLIPLNFSDEKELYYSNKKVISDQNKLTGVLSNLTNEETLILLDVVLTDDNKDQPTKEKAIRMSLDLYGNLLKNQFKVLYYSTCASDYRGIIKKEIYNSVIEMDWYDVRSSAIEIIRRAGQEYEL